MFSRLTVFALILLFVKFSNAELFKNAYLSFELPPHWHCKTEVTEWVCVSKYSQKAKEAIIILTAKEKGPTDSLQQYESYLKNKRVIMSNTGKELPSHVYTVKQVQINGHPWVDGLHINSEIESYYSRYLATTKDQIAVLVTFSGHKEHYTKYSQDFFKAIQSLRVNPPQFQQGLTGSGTGKGGGQTGTFGSNIGDPLNPGFDQLPEEPKTGFNDKHINLMALALILLAIGIFILRKKRTKKGK